MNTKDVEIVFTTALLMFGPCPSGKIRYGVVDIPRDFSWLADVMTFIMKQLDVDDLPRDPGNARSRVISQRIDIRRHFELWYRENCNADTR